MQTVEQRHRDAAADAMEAGYISASGIIAHVRAGRSDENAFVQAFARFEASLPPSAPVDGCPPGHSMTPDGCKPNSEIMEGMIRDFG